MSLLSAKLRYPVDKKPILAQIIAALTAELDTLSTAAREARENATDQEAKAEDKYDTRALESSYLADGQGRAALEVKEALDAYLSLVLRDFGPVEPIALTALVELEQRGKRELYFLGPRNGGITVEHDGKEIFVVTPQSPIGRKLLGRITGATVALDNGREAKITRVV